ncbi:MEKHLA domain-containing protein [Endozoicomonas sp.]|uniref:MEKHLA domain-containing protein n=1 Tax=Endozoicomonas sp. TaxID=1892382 RepID=UPI003AF5CEA7
MNDIQRLSDPFYDAHGKLICQSFRQLTGKELIPAGSDKPAIMAINEAPFALVSHGRGEDPVFNYGNRTALTLFEMDWEIFTTLPSRKSAEPVHRDERKQLLYEVAVKGYIDNYSGIRISAAGRRFFIHNAIVWNLIDSNGVKHGQAAMFAQWQYL